MGVRYESCTQITPVISASMVPMDKVIGIEGHPVQGSALVMVSIIVIIVVIVVIVFVVETEL